MHILGKTLVVVLALLATSSALEAAPAANILAFPSPSKVAQDSSANASLEVPATPFTGLAVDKAGDKSIPPQTVACFDLGLVSKATTSVVHALFRVQNQTTKPIRLDRLTPSCSCTSAQVLSVSSGSSEHPSVLNGPLAPGQTATILVTINSQDLSGPDFLKTVSVYAGSSSVPAAQLVVTGQLPNPAGAMIPRGNSPRTIFHYTPGNTTPVSSQSRIDTISVTQLPTAAR